MRVRGLIVALLFAFAGGCQTDGVEKHTAALTLSADSMAQRQMQSRRYDTGDERMILSAAAAVLQDLGFSIDESSARTGLLVASKDREAVEADQVAGQMFFAILVAAISGKSDPAWDHYQKIRVSLVTTPAVDRGAVVARVTFQRIVWNTKNLVSKAEIIDEPTIYREFFDKLSQSVFLEGHAI